MTTSEQLADSPPPRRTRARRGQGALLREEILGAATRLLLEAGDEDAVSIRAVSQAVGVTPPSIYLHFADKDALLFAVCESQFARLAEAMAAAKEGIADPFERLRACGRAYVEFGLAQPEVYRILFMTPPQREPAGFELTTMLADSGFSGLLEDVQRAIDEGAVAGDPFELSLVLWSGVHGLTSLLIAKPWFPWPEAREELITRHLDALSYGLHR